MSYFRRRVRTIFCTLFLMLFVSCPAFAANYKVIPNDTLNKIAAVFNTSASYLISSNNLSSQTIYPGQIIKVPGDTYTVKSGDTLYLISKKFGISTYSLKRANNIWTPYIYPGQKLAVPNANLNSTASSTSNSVIPYTSAELDLLARLIMAEAESESYTAKVGVGAVVINRVKHKDFPNTLTGVIYQKDDRFYQFTPVENGWIKRPASEDSKKAALDALKGWDPTKGAIYYFDDSATNKWLWSRPIALRSGHMVFTY